jgi:hypothetical protein
MFLGFLILSKQTALVVYITVSEFDYEIYGEAGDGFFCYRRIM